MTRFVRILSLCAMAGSLLLSSLATADGPAKKPQPKEEAKSGEGSQEPESKQPAKAKKSRKAENEKQPAAEPKVEPAKPEPEKPKTEAPKVEPKAAPAEQKPNTAKVAKQPFKIDVSMKGVFEPTNRTEIALRPKQWKELTVVKAVEHGRQVRKGDVLVELDLEKIDDQIADLKKDLLLSELSFKQAEANLKILEASTPLDLQLAARNKKNADEDLERFLKIDKPLLVKSADFMLKMSQSNLEYEKEELRQLEKMYKADDLTEETEEIILKRQRDAVERAEFFLENAKVNHEEALKIELPREEDSRRYLTEQQALLTQRTQATSPVQLEQQRIQLEKMKVERGRSEDRLKELEADREQMTVKAPADGIVYYGQYVRGQWTGATATADDLRPGGNLTREKAFMTIVQDRPMVVRADVPEASLHYVTPGLKATVEPAGYPEIKLSGTVDVVDAVPLGGQFAAVVKLALPHEAKVLVPGMSCTVKTTPYLKKSALVAAVAAVFAEKLDPDSRYVYLVRQGKAPQKQPVTVGKQAGDKIEILEGLDNGDEILLEEPKQKD
ncbi:MAG: HlyD family efflux transporter periplasmic adaptor subunit [Pirellulales bacterium]|nr:HlyD family efflux transporter periplasmic adaptor subunit [Pirellulales bacterium]